VTENEVSGPIQPEVRVRGAREHNLRNVDVVVAPCRWMMRAAAVSG
jgi:excinuclease UvrABC ATPase subunit